MAQLALGYGSGRYRELLVYEGEGEVVRALASTLLSHVEREIAQTRPLRVLVAVSIDAVTGELRDSLERDAAAGLAELPTIGKLLIQVAAENQDDVTFARRLIRFVVAERLRLLEEITACRRLQSRDNLGYKEPATPDDDDRRYEPIAVRDPVATPASGEEGPIWLLYQRFTQDVSRFAAVTPERREVLRSDHVALMKRVARETGLKGPGMQRRSFAYESVRESGLVFLAVAQSPDLLHSSLLAFSGKSDPFKEWSQPDGASKGLFVVPPTAAWLGGPVSQEPLPAWVTEFKRQHALVQYEVTPSTYRFLREVFRMNSRNLESGGQVRSDIQLVVRGLIKLVLGHQIANDGLVFQLLERMFGTVTGEQPIRARSAAPSRLLEASALALEREWSRQEDNSTVLANRLQALITLAASASAEARAVNQEADEYITFSV